MVLNFDCTDMTVQASLEFLVIFFCLEVLGFVLLNTSENLRVLNFYVNNKLRISGLKLHRGFFGFPN